MTLVKANLSRLARETKEGDLPMSYATEEELSSQEIANIYDFAQSCANHNIAVRDNMFKSVEYSGFNADNY